MIVAAVDIGSTSTRFLVTDGRGDLHRQATVTGLGRGLDERGTLADQAVAATLAVLAEAAEAAACHGAAVVHAVATSGLRRALDAERFLDRAAEVLGVRPEIIDGAAEGQLAFAGATGRLDPALGPFVVVDLGGGSCEFAVGSAGRCDGVFSAEFGAARLTETYIEHDPPRPEELVACLSIVEAHLEDVRQALPGVADARTWVGVAGTFNTFAAVDLGLAEYQRQLVNGFELTKVAAEDVYRTLVTERFADRIHNPGLSRDRAEVIVGGACAVVAIFRGFGLDRMMISDDDALDGLAARLLG